MDTEKNSSIEKILESLDGIQRAQPSPFLYSKILHKISERAQEYTPAKLVWLAAASFTLLIILNWQALKRNTNTNLTQTENSIEILANQYQLLDNNTINYN